MRRPSSLTKGDKIGIVSTARKISRQEISKSIEVFNSWGLEVVLGKHIFDEHNQFAGTDEVRAEDFQLMLDDKSIKAIICSRGGYGTVRIIDRLDFSSFIENPKWIIGYSDITVLHSHIHTNFSIATIHATMPVNIREDNKDSQNIESLRRSLFGEEISYVFKSHKLNRNGSAAGILTGGNLSILYSLSFTASDINTEGKILFLEDLDEYLYHIDRMIMNLKRSGKLSKLKALIIGGMSEMRDNNIAYGMTAEEIIADAVKEYDYPVCFDFTAGHSEKNYSLILGSNVQLDINNTCNIKF